MKEDQVTDPISNIEEEKGQRDVGILAVRVLEGAREESGSWVKAFWATAAYFYGAWKSPPGDTEDEGQAA